MRRTKRKKGGAGSVSNTRTNRQIWKSDGGTKVLRGGLISQRLEVDDSGIKEVRKGCHENR